MNPIFQSFWMGGYECADHINRKGERVNLLYQTDHHTRVHADYALLEDLGIKTVREGLCWSAVEPKPFYYDFTEVINRLQAGIERGIEQIWDVCHFGYPDDLIPTHPMFVARFTALCRQFVSVYRNVTNKPLYIIPINEISFLSWHSGDVRGTVPFAVNSGFDIKYHLCKAAIAGIKVIKETDCNCRIVLAEPLVKVHPATNEKITAGVIQLNENQFQAMDMIGGYMCPELGGRPEYLDILGFNYYHNCQWETTGATLDWETDNRLVPLQQLLVYASQRYKRPMFIAETGHYGEGRAQWIQHITKACLAARAFGVNLQGICIYPLINRPDWDETTVYHNSGLWEIDEDNKQRTLNIPYYEALKACIEQYQQQALPMAAVQV